MVVGQGPAGEMIDGLDEGGILLESSHQRHLAIVDEDRLEVRVLVSRIERHNIRGSPQRAPLKLVIRPVHRADERSAAGLISHVQVHEARPQGDVRRQQAEAPVAIPDPRRHGDLVVAVLERMVGTRDIDPASSLPGKRPGNSRAARSRVPATRGSRRSSRRAAGRPSSGDRH